MPLPDELKELAARVSNWGRWGDDDERGTLNFIGPEAVMRGISAALTGRTFSLTLPMDETGPSPTGIPDRTPPVREMIFVNVSMTGDRSDFTTSDDKVSMGVQGATHWDALAHAGYEHKLYNGIDDSVITETGASKLGIENFGPVASRGVLLDLARVHGVDCFDEPVAFGADDLDRAVDLAGVTIEPGDILCVRTGQTRFLHAGDVDRYEHPTPGLGVGSIEWLYEREVAAVATDTMTFEVFPGEDPAVLLPVHMIHLRDMGLVQGQLWDLEELATDCAADGRYDFLLVATPLPFTHAVGGTVAPTAIK